MGATGIYTPNKARLYRNKGYKRFFSRKSHRSYINPAL
jgi:hypothetical protein